jgi:hypothetical protein
VAAIIYSGQGDYKALVIVLNRALKTINNKIMREF